MDKLSAEDDPSVAIDQEVALLCGLQQHPGYHWLIHAISEDRESLQQGLLGRQIPADQLHRLNYDQGCYMGYTVVLQAVQLRLDALARQRSAVREAQEGGES